MKQVALGKVNGRDEVIQVTALFLNLLLLACCQALAQVALPVVPNSLVQTPHAWERFRETDLLAAVTRADLGVSGPVETVTTKYFWVESAEDESVEQVRMGPRDSGPMAIRHTFDEDGYLRQIEQLGSNDEPLAKYIYSVSNGIYAGYQLYINDRGSDDWTLRETLKREVVSSRKVVVTLRSHIPEKSKDLHFLYDERGLLVAEERYDPVGTFRARTTYRYLSGHQVEKTDGTNTTRYQYNPESYALGPGLLVARRYYSTANFQVFNKEGELVFENSVGENLLRTGSNYLYQADGRLVEVRNFRVTYGESGVGVKRASSLERFRDGLLIEETGYNSNVITEAVVHEYEASQLIRTSERFYNLDGTVTASQCENQDFDQYRNWTVRRCTPTIEEDELHQVLDPFRGRLITRAFTYH